QPLRLPVSNSAQLTKSIATHARKRRPFVSPEAARTTVNGNKPVRNAPSSWLSPKPAVLYSFGDGEKLSTPDNATAMQPSNSTSDANLRCLRERQKYSAAK